MSGARSVSGNLSDVFAGTAAALTLTALAGTVQIVPSGAQWLSSPQPEMRVPARASSISLLAANTAQSQLLPSVKEDLDAQRRYIRALQNNWDGYGAPPIDPRVIDLLYSDLEDQFPRMDVRLPDIIPAGDGSVQAEWHLNEIDLVYNVGPSGARYLSVGDQEFFGHEAREAFAKWVPFLLKKALPLVA